MMLFHGCRSHYSACAINLTVCIPHEYLKFIWNDNCLQETTQNSLSVAIEKTNCRLNLILGSRCYYPHMKLLYEIVSEVMKETTWNLILQQHESIMKKLSKIAVCMPKFMK